jgi:ABC-type transport system substrate-binding protein
VMSKRTLSRRSLLAFGAVAGAALLAACGGAAASTPAPPTPAASGETASPPPTAAPLTTKPAASGAAPSTGAVPAAAVTSSANATPAAGQAGSGAAASVGTIGAAPPSAPRRGGTITALVQNDWVTMDPVYNSASYNPQLMIYDPLFFFAPDDKGNWAPRPGLAEKWEFGDTSGTLKLRQGVKFHDGSDFNADVAKWNVDRMVKDPKSLARSAMQGVDTNNPATIVDDYTLKINLTRPTPSLVERMSQHNCWIVSKAAFEKMGAEQFAKSPVGSGPFQFVEWKSGDHVTVRRFDGYWQKGSDGKPLPYLDGITFRLIIDDSVRVNEMRAHTGDFTELVPGRDVPGVKGDSQLAYQEASWCGNVYTVIFSSRNGPFSKERKLRQAALYAIDRAAIAKALGGGIGTPLKYLLLPGSLGYDESLPAYGYEPDKAKALMKEAGLDGGVDVTLTAISRELDKAQAEILKQMWDKVGIRTKIDVLERAAWVAKLMTQHAPFDVATLRSGFSAGDPDLPFRTFQWSKANFNVANIADPKMDELIDKAGGTYDLAARASGYKEAQRYDFDIAYYGYIWMQNWNWVASKRLVGVPKPMITYWDFRTASLEG